MLATMWAAPMERKMVVMWDGKLVGWRELKLVEKTALRKVGELVEMLVCRTAGSLVVELAPVWAVH
jgi:hypothetical protein